MNDRPGIFGSLAEALPFLCAVVLTWAIIIGGLVYVASSMVPAP